MKNYKRGKLTQMQVDKPQISWDKCHDVHFLDNQWLQTSLLFPQDSMHFPLFPQVFSGLFPPLWASKTTMKTTILKKCELQNCEFFKKSDFFFYKKGNFKNGCCAIVYWSINMMTFDIC